jgi:hypothetical protein
MKIIKIILSILLILIIGILIFGWVNGLFTPVTVIEKEEGGYKLAGMEYVGAYKNAGKFMNEVEMKLKNAGLECKKGFGIYYDDPKTTPEEKCRSFVGGVLEGNDYSKIPDLESVGFKVDSIDIASSMVVEFPIKSDFSYMIGPMKAYPAISKQIMEKGYKVNVSLEVYNKPEKKIVYIMQYTK